MLALPAPRRESRAPGPRLPCLPALSRVSALPGFTPGSSAPFSLQAAWGTRAHEPPHGAAGWPRQRLQELLALGRCGPLSPARELRPFLLCPLAGGRRGGCWSAVQRPRDWQPRREAASSPAASSGRGLSRGGSHPSQRESCQQRVAGRGVPLRRATCQIKAAGACAQPE